MSEQSIKIESITISTHFENAVPDSEYVPESATYPESMIDAATARVVAMIQELYPGSEVASTKLRTIPDVRVEFTSADPHVASELARRGVRYLSDSMYDDHARLQEDIAGEVASAWESALSDPTIIATPLAK